MPRIEKYFFVERNHLYVVNPEEHSRYSVAGNVYGREGFPDGAFIATSSVKEIEGNVIKTHSGSQYQLGAKNPDLLDMEEAIRQGVPVINLWDLDWFSDGEFTFEGWLLETGEAVRGKITSQEGNFITLDRERKFFVVWRNLKNIFTYDMFVRRFFKCEDAWSEECRPVFFNKN